MSKDHAWVFQQGIKSSQSLQGFLNFQGLQIFEHVKAVRAFYALQISRLWRLQGHLVHGKM
jgi:hypothetical protein